MSGSIRRDTVSPGEHWVDNIVRRSTLSPEATGNKTATASRLGPLEGLPSRSADARQETPGPDDSTSLHMHDMWDRPTLSRLSAGRDSEFRKNLVQAYLTKADGVTESKGNVSQHLWTELNNLHALYRPVTKLNGAEVEIPRTMLDRELVSVHFEGELDALIRGIENPRIRQSLLALRSHPTMENIGLRADVNRSIYTFLYTQPSISNGRELNAHTDIDTLGTMLLLKEKYSESERPSADQSSEVNNLANEEDSKNECPKAIQSSDVNNLANEKMRLSAMKTQLPTAATRQAASFGAQKSVDYLWERGFTSHSKKDVNYPGEGYKKHVKENDFLVVRPHSRKAGDVLMRIIENFERDVVDESNKFAKKAIFHAENLMTLNGVSPLKWQLKQNVLVDYFMLAERIKKAKPAIDEKIQTLRECADHSPVGSDERGTAERQILALEYVCETSANLVKGFVNYMTYSPLVADCYDTDVDHASEAVRELAEKTLFGINVPITITNNWWENSRFEKVNANDETIKKAFREVKAMLRTPTMEDLY
jgi:hypothetical protein